MSDLCDRGRYAHPIYHTLLSATKINIPARRVQRLRGKGVPLPAGSIYVGRGTRWANPFAMRQWGHAKSVTLHRRWISGELGALSLDRLGFSDGEIAALDRWRVRILMNLHELAGHDLACWCSINCSWCHADIYLELAPTFADYERFAI